MGGGGGFAVTREFNADEGKEEFTAFKAVEGKLVEVIGAACCVLKHDTSGLRRDAKDL